MHYLLTKKKEHDIRVYPQKVGPFNVLNLHWEESLSIDLSYFDAGAKYANNNHLLATISIHPKSQFPVDFSCALYTFSLRFEMLFITRRFN